MSKVIMEFDSLEDKEDIRIHMAAGNMHALLWDLDQAMRRVTKYADGEEIGISNPTEEQIETISKVREYLGKLLSEYNIQLYT